MGEPTGISYSPRAPPGENPYILGLDIGTTNIMCQVCDKNAKVKGVATEKMELLHPKQGWCEIDQDQLWNQVQVVIKGALEAADIRASDVTCMGMTTQRNTFITWDRETGKPFHRFITWQDLRASDYVKSWNESFTMMAFNKGSTVLHAVTRKTRFLSSSVLRFKSVMVTMRLLWVLKNIPEAQKRAKEGKMMFGCLDTWLLWKLTGGREHATDYSCASSTGIYDAFLVEWSGVVCKLVGLPMDILPEVKDTSGLFGTCDTSIFGAAIPITAIVADQQSSMYAHCCFEPGDIKCTMGTGTFIDCNTGSKPHASVAGLYPLIGWKIGSEIVFIAEGLSSDTGICMDWAKELGLFDDVSDTSRIAESVPDSGGAYFIPAFSGLQAPINDDKACACLMGLTPNTTKAHLVRAILESLAFRCKLLYDTVLAETHTRLSTTCKIDGGVCNNDFLMQLTSDLINCTLDRSENIMNMTNVGAVFLAGLAVGIWKDKEELKLLRRTAKVFTPKKKKVPTATLR